ncbi:class I SAM-dependent methyltransferase [Microbacterium trichothecenolyticum]|uniref:16S rRNA (Guanine1207-N2)-methyltransferase n=1 Tax=Microbacterium trichothecenolyticum TaxID=69370 RepID=A0ABU0TPG2_MICTR|nr:methyltransferase [Microbacterium trichothecenolyticum]MDQ1121563.1 16S rRNA (guanine1207-N2)-methyltransferase [Microbacterium trichothecenolyticum]
MPFSFAALRRRPDVEGPDLVAVDAADRLILDESAAARARVGDGELVVIGDAYGALTLGAAAAGARGIRVHQDELLRERALEANAVDAGLADASTSHDLGADLLAGARVVLLRLPRSLAALGDIAGLIALHAHPDAVVFAGGRIKHMSVTMNDVLRERFDRVDVTRARQKSRVLVARGPHDGAEPQPASARVDGIEVRAFGGAFAGASIDIGTRLLLAHLPEPAGGDAVDLACGTGVVAATLALRHPALRVRASDQSAVAVASARATAEANGVADRVEVVRDDVLSSQPGARSSFIALNPPFHAGAAIDERLAPRMFADAARVLRPGGELWTVWNSALRYRPALERIVGPTRQVARDRKFTVTVSTKR